MGRCRGGEGQPAAVGQQPLAGLVDGIGRSLVGLLQDGTAALLGLGHPPLASQRCPVESQDELAVGGDQQMEVVRVVLAGGEGLEAVQDQGLAEAEVLQAAGVEHQGLPCQTGVAVGQKPGGDPQGAAGLTQSRAADQQVLDQTVVEGPVDPVVDVEGAAGEAAAARETLEAGNRSQDPGGPGSPAAEPGKLRILRILVGGTGRIGAEGRREGHGVSPCGKYPY